MTDDRTPHLNLPLPHTANLLSEDVHRLRDGITTIDQTLSQQNQTQQRLIDELATTQQQLAKLKVLALAGL